MINFGNIMSVSIYLHKFMLLVWNMLKHVEAMFIFNVFIALEC